MCLGSGDNFGFLCQRHLFGTPTPGLEPLYLSLYGGLHLGSIGRLHVGVWWWTFPGGGLGVAVPTAADPHTLVLYPVAVCADRAVVLLLFGHTLLHHEKGTVEAADPGQEANSF